MFLKSKQQIIREQLQLKPQKSSQSLRQSLPSKSTKNTATSKTRTEGEENAAKALSAIPSIVTELRKNAKIPEKVEQFLASLTTMPAQFCIFLQAKNWSEFSKVWIFHAFLAREKQSRLTL